ncbi:MAG: hypothetical protein RLZZ385_1514 [Pseudomonadota bacterium]|jgi:ATP-binding cassette subfamily F protein uup
MPLLRLDKVSLHFGTHVLLDGVELTLRKGEHIGLLGRNGAGKTTLMRVIAGLTHADSGERWIRPGVQVAWLDQSLPEAGDSTVYDWVAGGLPEIGALLTRYHHLLTDFQAADMAELEKVQEALEARDGWNLGQRVDTVISQLQLPAEQSMSALSGGWRKRVALARALVCQPEILLLDEPTNHLDIPTIQWLEAQLQEYRGALLLVTHDRAFLQAVVNTIIELDRGHLYQYEGSYHEFLRFREQQLEAEERANALFDKKLAEEEVWIRQGIKARRTRNEGRVRALEAMRRERSQRREQTGNASFKLDTASRSGKIVAELEGITHRFGDQTIIRNFSTTILRGDRIGLVGTNGAGKSTLLKIILGQLAPTEGTVTLGSKLEVAYFDQLRSQLDPELNLIDNVCGGQEYIEIDGRRKHAISYLSDFLFTADRIRTPAKALSGGEQNRAILAKLFSKPANVLVLDEPTNDLDIETLELLEDILLKFTGTVLLVSHDREFMDNVVTSILVFEGRGRVQEFVGGFSDWAAKGGRLVAADESVTPGIDPGRGNAGKSSGRNAPVAVVSPPPAVSKSRKLSYKEQRELDALPGRIEQLEQRQAQLTTLIAQPDFYGRDSKQVEQVLKELAALEEELQGCYGRWAELE